MPDPWGEFADAPSASPALAAPPPHADPYAEFSDARPLAQPIAPMTVAPGAIPHDGDTFPLGGRNGRLFGVDAFELGQPGYQRSGPVDLGAQARSVLLSRLQSGATATPTGTQSYGRPVVSLTNPAGDVGKSILDAGMGLATPNYLRGDPARFGQYMEAERLARLNRRGAFAGQFQAPWDYRHHVPDPWAQAQPSTDGKGTAMFWDEPTPFQGLRPEIAKAYLDLARSPTSSPDDLVNFARANRFTINPEDARSFVKKRQAGTPVSDELLYRQAPRVLTDPGDGAFGAGVRGFGDPLNMLDEMGGVVDALGGTGGRENVWNSDRRFGDILYNNIDQNRSILEHDDVYHPWARLGGQFVSGAMIPAGSVEGVGFNAARTALRAGASRFAAEAAAKSAVRNRLIATGAGFGGVAGFGAGEGGPLDRLPSTLEGAGIGAAGGAALGLAAPYAVRGARAVRQFARDRFGGAVDDVPAGAGVDHWDEFADAPPHVVDRLDVGSGDPQPHPGLLPEAAGPPINTGRPVRPPLPPRTQQEVQADIDAWAAAQGARAANGSALPEVMLHGSPYPNITSFDPYGRSGYGLFGSGTYLTDNPQIAGQYSKKGIGRAAKAGEAERSIYAVNQSVRNPIDMDQPADIAAWEKVGGEYADFTPGMTNEQAYRAVEDALLEQGDVPAWEGAEIMSDMIRGLGHDGITHIGGGRVGNGPRHRVLIALDPEQTTIRDRLSMDRLMTPPAPREPDWIDIADVPGSTGPTRTAAMASDVETPSISAPADPYAEFADLMPNARPIDQRATSEEMAALARSVNPEDVTPIPANAVESMDEAAGIGAGMRPLVDAPNERSVLPPYRLTPGGPVRRDPLDLIGWLRTQGGIREQGGELAHAGIDNTPRQIPFAKSEGFLGSLVRPEGMTFDDAALRAWEAGFFPDHVERPTVADFVDALRETHRGGPSRVFHPDDYDALDAYDAAQAQRGRVETAAQEGTPLVEDRGQPVDLHDLEANQPPATAYEDLPSVGGKAGNIRLDGLESPEDIRRALLSTDAKVGGFDAARRGRVSQGETQALANELGMTADDLLKRRHGQALNAEQALAARSILARSAQDLVRLARNAQSGTDEAIATFRKAWLRHVAIQEQVSGATAEAGRALAQFKMAAQAGNAPRVLKHLITEGGGRDDIEDVARQIIDLQDAGGTPGQVNKFAADALKPKFKDKLIELWYNSLLSGPQTHVVNIVSNSLTAALQIPEHMAAAGLGAARNVVARGDVDRVLGSEVGARMVGLLQGTREGLRAFARTARTGDVPDHVTKVEARVERAISGLKGEIIRTPTRLLSAEDELFKGIGRRMEINGLAVRQAASEGLKGRALAKRVAELSQNPTDEMTEQAMDYARYVTFQRPLNEWGQATSAFTQKVWPLKFIIPFLRTPTNMLKFAVERSPLAPATRHWRADVMAGGARRDLAIAKAALGTGLGLMVTQWAADGHITGNIPADRKEADLLRADGWQPYSIRVGDRYYSYSRLDPMSTTLSAAADIATAARNGQTGDPEKAVNALVSSIIDQIDSKTFLSGVASLMHTIDPNGNGGIIDRGSTYLGRQAGSMLVPAIASQAARTIDPTLRETRGFLPSIESRVPFLSRTLPARADVWGHDIVSQGGLGPDLISPMRMSARRFDPVNTTLLGIGASMGQPSKVLGGVKLSPAQYDAYQRAQGDLIYRSMQGAVANPAFIDLPPLEKLKQFDTLKRDARRSVREGMFGAKR